MWKPVFDDVTKENIDHAIEQGNELYDSHYRILHINAFDNQVWVVAERGRVNNVHRISDVFEKSKSRTLNEMTNNEINDLEIFGLGFSLSNEKTNKKIDSDELVKDLCYENELNISKDLIIPRMMDVGIHEGKPDEGLWCENKLNGNKNFTIFMCRHSLYIAEDHSYIISCNKNIRSLLSCRVVDDFFQKPLHVESEFGLKNGLSNVGFVRKYFHEARIFEMISEYVASQCKSNTESENRDNLPAVISQR
ncbi:hypothetical protein [Komagataeibacter europaeus]|uniref:hypothetical protein n=1 Tax=Komagataeibacter europaeus TaxID=33995 RepID=UPI0012DD1EA8|nr:hypothetical protein [Komagataeibacter europaeus]